MEMQRESWKSAGDERTGPLVVAFRGRWYKVVWMAGWAVNERKKRREDRERSCKERRRSNAIVVDRSRAVQSMDQGLETPGHGKLSKMVVQEWRKERWMGCSRIAYEQPSTVVWQRLRNKEFDRNIGRSYYYGIGCRGAVTGEEQGMRWRSSRPSVRR